jgi:snurportin-1
MIDDLTSIVDSMNVTLNNNENIASNIHPRLDAYKRSQDYISNQEERRLAILKEQKKRRSKVCDINRSITTIENDENHQITKENDHEMSTCVEREAQKNINYFKKDFTKQNRLHRPRAPMLMFSEWLEEIPNDFTNKWIMIICPIGKRCLVIAKDGITNVYNKGGKLIAKHSSKLPGGNKESKIDETILDCIYNDAQRVYYVLDCLCWRSRPIKDTEVQSIHLNF